MNKKRKIIVGSTAAAVIVIGGGAFAAAQLLGDNDIDMAAHLPGSAVGYMEVDLNPSLEQKVAGLSLASKLESLMGDDTRENESLEESLAHTNFEGVDYKSDVKPWIGTQFAVAPISPKAEEVVSLYSVKDRQKAEDSLPKLNHGDHHYSLEKDYLVVTDTTADYDAYASALTNGTLSDNDEFTRDRKAMDDNIAFAWADLGRVEFPPGKTMSEVPDLSGRVAATVRLSGDSVDLNAKSFDLAVEGVDDFSTATSGTTVLGELGADTVGGIGVADISNTFRKNWDAVVDNPAAAGQIAGSLDPLGQMLGLKLPQDADKVIGDYLAVGYESDEKIRVVARGADAGTWDTVAGMVGAVGGSTQTTTSTHGEDIHVLFNGDAAADAGRLRDHPLYSKALPQIDTAQFAAWLDLNKVQAMSEEPETKENEGVVGATISYDQDKAEHDIAVHWVLK
ncbi:hypothetical protein GCM10009596_00650 [Arthrobacter rhombi]|uniref:hypothetical protein n=1 Tax=Arthrobacter rhombi TaxID=71253 RepID=UPI0031E139E4